MPHLYGLNNCDTCRKALKTLAELKMIDVRTDGVPPDLLARAQAQFGPALLNTRSTTWRALSEEERAMDPLDLIARHPAVMKRPLISVGDQLFLGWSPETVAQVKAAL